MSVASNLQTVLNVPSEPLLFAPPAGGLPARTSLEALREGGVEALGDRVASRLADAHALFGVDMGWVDGELARLVRQGAAPAVDAAVNLFEAGGKRVRPLATLLSSACFREPAAGSTARELAVVAELVHLATLLHDDVVDDAGERRGRPTSCRLWGNAVSVLAGDLLLTHALERASATGDREALRELFATLRTLVDGEVVQLRGRRRLDLDEATYFQVVHGKTASLFRWACRAGARAGGAPEGAVEAFGAFGGHLGVAFQLVDDVLDYAGDPAATGKALHADLHEGKLTLPLLRAVTARPSLVDAIERARGGDVSAADALAVAVVASGACASVRDLARAETQRAREALDAAPAGRARDLLAAVAADLAGRAG